jgi:hypothetical protein
MSTWIEIRCTDQLDLDSRDRCWSADNSGPMQMASDDNASILLAISNMRKDAVKAGWVRKSSGWVCPSCTTTQPSEIN